MTKEGIRKKITIKPDLSNTSKTPIKRSLRELGLANETRLTNAISVQWESEYESMEMKGNTWKFLTESVGISFAWCVAKHIYVSALHWLKGKRGNPVCVIFLSLFPPWPMNRLKWHLMLLSRTGHCALNWWWVLQEVNGEGRSGRKGKARCRNEHLRLQHGWIIHGKSLCLVVRRQGLLSTCKVSL